MIQRAIAMIWCCAFCAIIHLGDGISPFPGVGMIIHRPPLFRGRKALQTGAFHPLKYPHFKHLPCLPLGAEKPHPPSPACVALPPCFVLVLDKPILDGLHALDHGAIGFIALPVRYLPECAPLRPQFQNRHVLFGRVALKRWQKSSPSTCPMKSPSGAGRACILLPSSSIHSSSETVYTRLERV